MADQYFASNLKALVGADAFQCDITEISLTPINETYEEDASGCGPGQTRTVKGPRKWECALKVKASFGTDGTWNKFHAMRDTEQVISLYPHDAVIAVANPEAKFTVEVGAIPFLEAKARDKSTIDIPVTVIGEPAFKTSPTA